MLDKKKSLFMLLIIIILIILAFRIENNVRVDSKLTTINFIKDKVDSLDTSMLNAEKDVKRISISGHFDRKIPSGSCLMLMLRSNSLKVYQNSSCIYTYKSEINNNNDNMPFSSEWITISSKGISSKDSISFEFTGNCIEENDIKCLDKIYSGSEIALAKYMLKSNIVQIIASFVIISLGIGYLIMMIFMRHIKRMISINLIAFCVLLISGGICTFIDYRYISFICSDIKLINEIDFVSQVGICVSLLLYLRYFLSTKISKKILLLVSFILTACIVLNFVLNEMKICNMTDFVKVMLPIVVIVIISVVIILIRDYCKYNDRIVKIFLQSGLILATFTLVEIVHFAITSEYWIVVFQFGLIIFASIQFYIMICQARVTLQNAEDTERKIVEDRIAVMMSQIQPHFLYNALEGIAELCRIDSDKAEKAITDFSIYLRGNMDSLSTRSTIPFNKELEHTMHYLKLEKIRFEERLNIEYDIQSTMFRLPPLTLQPLVENAVRWGVTRLEEGGTIKISSKENEQEYIVTISDDGIGYDVNKEKNDGISHVGTTNVRERLKIMCNGKLTINSTPGLGTNAIISIPKEEQ